jgi:hypothetical protein
MMAGRRLALKTVLAISIKLKKVWLPNLLSGKKVFSVCSFPALD